MWVHLSANSRGSYQPIAGMARDEEDPFLKDEIDSQDRKGSWFSRNHTKALLLVGFTVAIVVIVVILAGDDDGSRTNSASKSSFYANGAVAADQPTCSKMGADILRKGGNAVDAAVTTSLCLGLLNPFASGIGGGGFMIIHTPSNLQEVIDFREIAPFNSSREMFFQPSEYSSTEGGRAVAVPSELRGLELAFKRHGSKAVSWSDLVLPVAKVAREGFVITEIFEKRLNETAGKIRKWPKIYSVFAPNGVFLREGDILKRPDLAEVFEKVAAEGADVFYQGEIANDILDTVNQNTGNMTQADLDAAIPVIREPLVSNYHGLRIFGAPPPSSGGVAVGFMLSVLEKFDFKTNGMNGQNTHRTIESMKFSFAQRTQLGDPKYVPGALDVVDRLYSTSYQDAVRENITEVTHEPEYYVYEPVQFARDHGTSHFSIVDKDRMAVSCTSTVNLSFGSKLMTNRYGILLNNQMDDFSVQETNSFGLPFSESNAVGPHKKPLSSMSPTIILDANDKLYMSVGASGGPRIISTLVEVILDIQEYNMDVLSSVTVPRFHHQWVPNTLLVERGFEKSVLSDLQKRGHQIDIADNLPDGHTIGNAQVILIKKDGLYAASDPRKQGLPDGY